MTTGLTQRRRNNGGSTDAFDEVQDPLTNRLSPQTSEILDPQSLPHEQDDDDKKERQLTLMEQVLLLGLKDSQVVNQNTLTLREHCLFGTIIFHTSCADAF